MFFLRSTETVHLSGKSHNPDLYIPYLLIFIQFSFFLDAQIHLAE